MTPIGILVEIAKLQPGERTELLKAVEIFCNQLQPLPPSVVQSTKWSQPKPIRHNLKLSDKHQNIREFILKKLMSQSEIGSLELTSELKTNREYVCKQLRKLIEEGLIERIGQSNQTKYRLAGRSNQEEPEAESEPEPESQPEPVRETETEPPTEDTVKIVYQGRLLGTFRDHSAVLKEWRTYPGKYPVGAKAIRINDGVVLSRFGGLA